MAWGRRSNHKFNAMKVETARRSFDSKLEAAVFELLWLRERAGEIRNIQQQAQIDICGPIGHACHYKSRIYWKPDFKAEFVATGEPFYVESKGFKTPSWAIKLRLIRHYCPIPVELWEGSHTRPQLTETIYPSRGGE